MKAKAAVYSPMHRRWVVLHPTEPSFLIGSGSSKELAEADARRKRPEYFD